MSIKNKSVLVRLTKEEHKKLDEVAKKHDRSYSYLVRKALLQLLEDEGK